MASLHFLLHVCVFPNNDGYKTILFPFLHRLPLAVKFSIGESHCKSLGIRIFFFLTYLLFEVMIRGGFSCTFTLDSEIGKKQAPKILQFLPSISFMY